MTSDMLDVIVIGAGMAGITAARELSRVSLSVAVLEARDRFGGLGLKTSNKILHVLYLTLLFFIAGCYFS